MERIHQDISEKYENTGRWHCHECISSFDTKGLFDVSGPLLPEYRRSQLFDLADVAVCRKEKQGFFGKDLPDSNLTRFVYILRTLEFSRAYSSRFEMYGRDVRDIVNFLIDSLKYFSFFFSLIFVVFVSDVQLSRLPCFLSFAEDVLEECCTYLLRFIFSFAPSPSAYFGESLCISNSNSCKDCTCPTALRSFFDAARTVPMTFLVKFSPRCCSSPESLHKRPVWTNPERFVNCDL